MIKKADLCDTKTVRAITEQTINSIYPKYYPKEVVDFFCQLHCLENIRKDVEDGRVGVLKIDNEIVGTGCYKENHITRVYVKPSAQRKGYGSCIMQCLENAIRYDYDTVNLDASLPACCLYEKRGYKTVKHERWNVENGVVLVYEIMEKHLQKCNTCEIVSNDL